MQQQACNARGWQSLRYNTEPVDQSLASVTRDQFHYPNSLFSLKNFLQDLHSQEAKESTKKKLHMATAWSEAGCTSTRQLIGNLPEIMTLMIKTSQTCNDWLITIDSQLILRTTKLCSSFHCKTPTPADIRFFLCSTLYRIEMIKMIWIPPTWAADWWSQWV
jgi:hypothetical protein